MRLIPQVQQRSGVTVEGRGVPWFLPYTLIAGAGLFVGLAAHIRSGQIYFGLCLVLLMLLMAAWLRFPVAALASVVFLTLVGDSVTASWFPFTKNLSSYESIFFVSPALTFSPLDVAVATGLLTLVWRNLDATGRVLRSGNPLMRPMLVLAGLCLLGLFGGLVRSGNLRVAIFEIRPLLYLPVMFLLFVEICRGARDYRFIFTAVILGVVVQSTLSIQYFYTLLPEQREVLEALGEHGAAIGMNLVLVAFVFSVLTPNVPRWIPTALIVALVPVGVAYIVSQRRAAILALGAAFAIISLTLWWRRRRKFWLFVPVLGVVIAGYVAAFWNVNSGVGFPAQAVKDFIAPDSMSAKDRSSNLYRDVENYNLWATIRADPVFGQGFGRPFLRPVQLPTLSTFEFQRYIPHNSLLWIWIKLGFFGFIALLYAFARVLTLGVDRYRRTPAGVDAVVTGTLLTFVVMFAVFTYVDIAWEPRNVLLLALSFALLTSRLIDPYAETHRRAEAERDIPGKGRISVTARSVESSSRLST